MNRFTLTAAATALSALVTPALAADKGEVELAYVEWSTEIASTNVVKVVLEDLGYDVKITPVSAAAMWQAVGTGDVDGLVAAWLPTTHMHYLEKVADDVEDLGPNLEGTRIGLVVPSYVEIDSIAELDDAAERFDNKIIGIDPGAGIMSKTELAIERYELEDITLVEGTGPIMTAVLGDAIDDNEWVVITGWTPHWMFAQYDLKYLEDPEGIYGGEEEIHTIVRKGLKEDMPEVYAVLDNFHWAPEQMAELMVWNQEKRADPYKNARRWVEENAETVESWKP
ncbi:MULTISPECIES: glycine betaine ABC transporter substrate-binding protein [Marichromatium]|uniref:Glycine betaine/proline transport system substrate-binding protein n=1 Tax=Marichromatium gracile TaxID=1048 RepID=A0A4R4AKQ2_MARGR|nr:MULTISPECIES: glycine betaine ABC transporter substrate-binding protein [Marichromatium]MBO8086072.1 glycine betaine ABC transporter substrate-binding protein [Marichromatium sp.]MBK1707661.1 glycine/betaine ABC transporter substrate-binding protein [Marichromatium gracile]RNE89986.1 glycine betaine ABC transporter substrate-binding protein [Marichromatium sp. AB32]RNE91865.1 glycine betaine ABC transporter substrate-binding protein [Marichromatium sp. AB31]TCW40013.1 glycine betaine/prolin